MEQKSTLNSGSTDRYQRRSPVQRFTESQKHAIIKEFLSSGATKGFIWEKYSGRKQGQFQITRWMRQYGYEESGTFIVTTPKRKELKASDQDSFEIQQLKKRIADLEKQVRDSEMKAIAYSTMVDIAEKEYNISIRKKYNTKPSNY